jgi:5-methyltetrahydrofolate--homocysteine methyltransferase
LILEGLKVQGIGVNCGTNPENTTKIIENISKITKLPILSKPNASKPVIKNNQITFLIDEKMFCESIRKQLEIGVSMIGGCCGTTPSYISSLKHLIDNNKFTTRKIEQTKITQCCSTSVIQKNTFSNNCIEWNDIDVFEEQIINTSLDTKDILSIYIKDNKNIDEINKFIEIVSYTITNPLHIETPHIDLLETLAKLYPGIFSIGINNASTDYYQRTLTISNKYGSILVLNKKLTNC